MFMLDKKQLLISGGAIHRGFSIYEKASYRNHPKWELAIELRRRYPEMPFICDPSHIGGDSIHLYDISQKAMDLNFDGLMIESHICPKEAWSDAKQQITPNELNDLLGRLILRESDSKDNKFLDMLNELRNQIDVFDDQLLDVIEQRMKVAETIGQYKRDNKITILQAARWTQILQTSIEKGEKKGLSPEFIGSFFKAIHQESINKQIQSIQQP